MSDIETARVAQNPRFQELVHERTRFGWVLTIVMLVIYFGFIGLIAFDKALLATKIGGGTASLGWCSAWPSSSSPSSSRASTSSAPTAASTT